MSEKYLMENDDEIYRLEAKTDPQYVIKQALWAGIKPGMRVADIGCGSGKTSAILHGIVQPGGKVVGVDGSINRINYAREHYSIKGLEYVHKDILDSLDDMGSFDFVWVRFVLEYYRSSSFDIVKNISKILKTGGILCIIDLDYNCLNHYGLSSQLENFLHEGIKYLEEKEDFDPYVGRKLYSFLYDLDYEDIDVDVSAHHLIFGKLKEVDEYNWLKKIEVVSKKVDFNFNNSGWEYDDFIEEFRKFFSDKRRFTYTPIISCRGRKS